MKNTQITSLVKISDTVHWYIILMSLKIIIVCNSGGSGQTESNLNIVCGVKGVSEWEERAPT
jgi:hypothetical protein